MWKVFFCSYQSTCSLANQNMCFKSCFYVKVSLSYDNINIVVALNLEWLYNKTSDLGIDYKKGCQVFKDFDNCTLYNVHCTYM